MYRPNFCAECGERIEHARRRWWTSGRFCPGCARQLRRGRNLHALCTVLLLFGLGFGAGRAFRPPPPLVVTHAALPTSAQTLTPDAAHPAQTSANPVESAATYNLAGPVGERPTDPNELISICGARTKKGTPCQRRVRGTGRCWQHLGQPAMLPPEKLIIQGQLPAAPK